MDTDVTNWIILRGLMFGFINGLCLMLIFNYIYLLQRNLNLFLWRKFLFKK